MTLKELEQKTEEINALLSDKLKDLINSDIKIKDIHIRFLKVHDTAQRLIKIQPQIEVTV